MMPEIPAEFVDGDPIIAGDGREGRGGAGPLYHASCRQAAGGFPGAGMRNVWLLTAAQALCQSGSFIIVLLGGILGSELAPSPVLATLPVSSAILGLALTTIPAALAMQRFGRRPVFVGSASLAAVACLCAGLAVRAQSFPLFCLALAFMGMNNSVVMQYRFAAIEHVPAARASRAVSTVMTGALVAAWLGPEVGVLAADWVPGAHNAGSFLAGAGLYVVAAVLLARLPPAAADAGPHSDGRARPLGEIAAQAGFRVAVLAGVVSYAVMSFIMTATPISMHVHDHFGENDTKWVIQSHLLAMFAPSLVSGRIVAALGAARTMAAGTLVMSGCVAAAVLGRHAVAHYWWAMVLLGLGWNLLFVAGTTLLTTTYRPVERFRAQAVNEFAVFGAQATASLLAGAALGALGWEMLNLATVPLLAAMLVGALMVHEGSDPD